MELQLPHIDHPVKLQSYLLRVGTEPARLPPGGPAEEQRAHGVVLLFGTAGDYFEFQLATHESYNIESGQKRAKNEGGGVRVELG